MVTKVRCFEISGRMLTNAVVAISLVVGSLAAYAEEDDKQKLDGDGGAINCTSGANEGINPHCNAIDEFTQTIPRTDRLILDFIKPRVLDSDLHENSPVSSWFFDVYKSNAYPIYLIYFKSQIYEDLTFERLTEYLEERNEQLNNYNYKSVNEGHDFAIADIAKFFIYMKLKNFPLNAMEAHLKRALTDAKIMATNSQGSYEGGDSAVAILALSQESPKGTLSHELNHGVFFTDLLYRQFIQNYWMNLDVQNKDFAQKTLSRITDGNLDLERDPSLFLREFAAYFRDSETLLREYFDEDEKVPENLKRILSIESGLRDIERRTPFYQGITGLGGGRVR